MNTLTALIADDEEAPRAQLRAALAQAWPELQVVADCVNGVDAWDAFLEHEPSVCFLDIRMPGLTGIEVAQRIDGRVPVVFVTAHGDHALAAFDAGAVDYVLKPVDPERLRQAVARARARLTLSAPQTTSPPGMADLLARLAADVGHARRPAALEVIQAGVGKEVRLIRVDEVVYFESDARYTRVVHEGGEALIRTPLKELLAQLDAQRFWQVHRSVIVNHRHISAAVRVDEGNMHLTLRDRPEKLPVSRHFQGLFKGQ
jgi:DNA-binding LytR/AlgR family response regulator